MDCLQLMYLGLDAKSKVGFPVRVDLDIVSCSVVLLYNSSLCLKIFLTKMFCFTKKT